MKTLLHVVGVLAARLAMAHPSDIRSANLEPSRGGKPRPPVLVPPDATHNVAQNCPVTASAAITLQDSSSRQAPLGGFPCITDGNKEIEDERVNLPPGRQWVQIDLGGTQEIWAVQIWHAYDYGCVYRDVVVLLSNDPAFSKETVTVFNNDHDNTSGLGHGEDKEYLESYTGRCIPVDGVCARYVRVYSNGCTETPVNRYTEIEVYGRTPVERQQPEPRVPLTMCYPKPGFS
jgi:hypothetical protein